MYKHTPRLYVYIHRVVHKKQEIQVYIEWYTKKQEIQSFYRDIIIAVTQSCMK